MKMPFFRSSNKSILLPRINKNFCSCQTVTTETFITESFISKSLTFTDATSSRDGTLPVIHLKMLQTVFILLPELIIYFNAATWLLQ